MFLFLFVDTFAQVRFHLDEWRTVGFESVKQRMSSPTCEEYCLRENEEAWEIGDKCSLDDQDLFNQTACSSCQPPILCKFTKYTKTVGIYNWMQWFNLFGFYWTMNFVTAYGELILAGIFARWYWTKHKSEIPCTAVGSSIFNATVYHLGTIAFGSLIIAIIKVIICFNKFLPFLWLVIKFFLIKLL